LIRPTCPTRRSSDLETISIALEAAETGHLVLATLHTTDAPKTVDRIIDVFPAHQQQQVRIQLASCLNAVIAQQLLPRVDGKGMRSEEHTSELQSREN